MSAHLHIHVAEASGPIRKEMPSQPLVSHAEPFGCDLDLAWIGLQNFIENTDERDREPFGKF